MDSNFSTLLTHDYWQDVANVIVTSVEVITWMVKEHSVNWIMRLKTVTMIFPNLDSFYVLNEIKNATITPRQIYSIRNHDFQNLLIRTNIRLDLGGRK